MFGQKGKRSKDEVRARIVHETGRIQRLKDSVSDKERRINSAMHEIEIIKDRIVKCRDDESDLKRCLSEEEASLLVRRKQLEVLQADIVGLKVERKSCETNVSSHFIELKAL